MGTLTGPSLSPAAGHNTSTDSVLFRMDVPQWSSICAADVASPEQILAIMAQGFEHRATGCHDINAHSSRSHCLLIIHAASTDPTSGVRSVGKLTLCDLAGSERINKTGATGDAACRAMHASHHAHVCQPESGFNACSSPVRLPPHPDASMQSAERPALQYFGLWRAL